MLKPVDITVLAWIATSTGGRWTQVKVANALGISQSNVHRALRQLERSALLRNRQPQPLAITELFIHGVRYVYPPQLGAQARGVVTAQVGKEVVIEHPLVWPCEEGEAFGTALTPLHLSVPKAALNCPRFYKLMSVLDVFRIGRARERVLAERWLRTAILGVSS